MALLNPSNYQKAINILIVIFTLVMIGTSIGINMYKFSQRVSPGRPWGAFMNLDQRVASSRPWPRNTIEEQTIFRADAEEEAQDSGKFKSVTGQEQLVRPQPRRVAR